MSTLQTQQQLILHLEMVYSESLMKEVEKPVTKCCYTNLKKAAEAE